LSDVPLNSSSKVQVQFPPSPSGVLPWQFFEVVVVVLGGLVVVVVVLVLVVVVVVVVVAGVVEVVVVGGAGTVVVVVVEGGAGLFVLIVLNLACAWSWNQEAEAGPGEKSGATKRVAVTAAVEVPAKSAMARLPRILSNNIPRSPSVRCTASLFHSVQRQSKEERATYRGPFGPERVNLGPLD
jgi:hypothetical protein